MADVRVVGIAGGSGSGKTTVADALSAALGRERCATLCHDQYYRDLPAGVIVEDWNYDHPDSLETSRLADDLGALARGESVRAPTYDFATHRRSDPGAWVVVEPRPVVIVEGILVLQDPALRAAMTHRVFVHTADDLRLARRIRRDLVARGRHVDDVLAQYLSTVRPMYEAFVAPSRAHAHLVLDGEAPVAASVAAVMALLGESGPWCGAA